MSIYETSITNPKKQLEFYKDLSEQLEKENQELKKKLEQCSAVADTNSELADSIDEHYKKQQKEFIEWLENLIGQNETVIEVSKYGLPKECSKLLIDFYKSILSKYKEIIGCKE